MDSNDFKIILGIFHKSFPKSLYVDGKLFFTESPLPDCSFCIQVDANDFDDIDEFIMFLNEYIDNLNICEKCEKYIAEYIRKTKCSITDKKKEATYLYFKDLETSLLNFRLDIMRYRTTNVILEYTRLVSLYAVKKDMKRINSIAGTLSELVISLSNSYKYLEGEDPDLELEQKAMFFDSDFLS